MTKNIRNKSKRRRTTRPIPFSLLAPGSTFFIAYEPSRRDPVTGRMPEPYKHECVKAGDFGSRSLREARDIILAPHDLVRPTCSPQAAANNLYA